MKFVLRMACVALAVALLPAVASAQLLFSEALDDGSADVTINSDGGISTFVDYSSFTVGTTTHSVVEAPRPVAGGAATSGLLLQVNVGNSTAEAFNVLAGASPNSYSGEYVLSFDAWINVFDPPPFGGTEQLLWGVGSANDGDLESRHTRGTADGIWGWLAGENGYGTEDAAIFVDATEAADLGDTQSGEATPFNAAFTTNFGLNDAPANSWVEVDIVQVDGNTSVKFNGVQFFRIPLLASPGAALFGYEDPFSSNSAEPDHQWGLFDNFTVTQIPEPTSLALASLMGLGLLGVRRRR